MSVELQPSKNYPGRTALHHKLHEDSNTTTIIELSDDDLSSLLCQLEQIWPADAGKTAYECPHHFNCDGGCGHVYNAAAGEKP